MANSLLYNSNNLDFTGNQNPYGLIQNGGKIRRMRSRRMRSRRMSRRMRSSSRSSRKMRSRSSRRK